MDIQSAHLERNSAQEFSKKLSTYLASGAGLLHVRTEEIMRALTAIRIQLLGEGMHYSEWDIVSGFREFTLDTLHNHTLPGDGNQDLSSALSQPLELIRDERGDRDTHQAFVYVNPHPFMDSNPHLNQLLLQYAEVLPSTNFYVILVTPDRPLPENTTSMLSIEFRPPGLTELRGALNEILDGVKDNFTVDLAEEELDKICYVGAGMTKGNFQMYASLATCQVAGAGKAALTVEDLIEGVSIGKTDIISQNDLLELYPSGKMANVGGLENLKAWIRKRGKCYSDEAREFGVEPPRGLVLVGLPGTGKSAIAKSIANEMGIPCVRLDFGRVFNSLVGASQQRIRTALKMAEDMAPCCTGDTLLRLHTNESITIAELYQIGKQANLQTIDPSTGEGISTEMTAIIRRSGAGKKMLRITTASGKEITVTDTHRLLRQHRHGMEWAEARTLAVGDDLVEE